LRPQGNMNVAQYWVVPQDLSCARKAT